MLSDIITRLETKIKERIASGAISPEKLASASTKATLDPDMFIQFQELKSLAFASGRLSLDDANLIYSLLGETPEHFARQSLGARYVLLEIFTKLLSWASPGVPVK